MNALAALLATAAAAAPPAVPAPVSPGAVAPATLDVPGFGTVSVHPPTGKPARVVLLLSGAGGRDEAGNAAAKALAAGGGLVVGVDTRSYLAARSRERCAYPAGDLETLAQHVEKAVALESYLRPIAVGHSRGAAVAWAALAQGPPGTFAGGVAVGICPERPLAFRLCPGDGPAPRRLAGGELPALARIPGPFEVVSGADDATCPPAGAEALAAAVGARFTKVAGAGHALSPAVVDAVAAAVARVQPPGAAAPPPPPVADLPIVEVRTSKPGTRFAVLLTGDGGWMALDRGLSAALAEAGVPLAGLDSLRYFWKRRTPDETARDVARILAHYRAAWGRDEALLIGYSRGADIVPFLVARLPPQERGRLRLVAMLGPGTFAELEVHAIDIFTSRRRRGALPTEDAVRATGGVVPMLCVHGSEEHDSLCPHLADLPWVKRIELRGGHHFTRDYGALAKMVLDAAP